MVVVAAVVPLVNDGVVVPSARLVLEIVSFFAIIGVTVVVITVVFLTFFGVLPVFLTFFGVLTVVLTFFGVLTVVLTFFGVITVVLTFFGVLTVVVTFAFPAVLRVVVVDVLMTVVVVVPPTSNCVSPTVFSVDVDKTLFKDGGDNVPLDVGEFTAEMLSPSGFSFSD